MKNIYVGNLSRVLDDEQLNRIFSNFGTVKSASVIVNHETGQSKGFGFVQMGVNDALLAIQALNGKEIEGKILTVNEAKPRTAAKHRLSRMGRHFPNASSFRQS